MTHAADQRPSRIGVRRQAGEPDQKLGTLTVPLSAVEGQQDGDAVELRVMATVKTMGKHSATVTLDDIQPTEAGNPATAMEASMRGKGA